MELCRFKTDEYAIAISLKYPPRLETQKEPISGGGWMFYTDERKRAIRFDSVPVEHFGESTAILLYFSSDDLTERLFHSQALQSVKNCGLIQHNLISVSQAVATRVQLASKQEKKNVEQSLVWIHEKFPKIGMFRGGVLGNHCCRRSYNLHQVFFFDHFWTMAKLLTTISMATR